MSGLDFGAALSALKKGRRVARAGWNGKGMWLVLVEPSPHPVGQHLRHANVYTVGLNVDPSHSSIRDWLYATPTQGCSIRALPWIGMKTADDGFVPWLASQTDVLAEDWEIIETPGASP